MPLIFQEMLCLGKPSLQLPFHFIFNGFAKMIPYKRAFLITRIIPQAKLIIAFSFACWYIAFAHYSTKGIKKSMTIKELKKIISNLPDTTVILIEETDINDVETINIQIHSDGRSHLILSALE